MEIEENIKLFICCLFGIVSYFLFQILQKPKNKKWFRYLEVF